MLLFAIFCLKIMQTCKVDNILNLFIVSMYAIAFIKFNFKYFIN